MVHSYLRDILLQQLKFDPFSIISGQNKLGDLRIYFILGGGAGTSWHNLCTIKAWQLVYNNTKTGWYALTDILSQ